MLLVLCIVFMYRRGVFKQEAVIKLYSCRAKDLGVREGIRPYIPPRQFSNEFTVTEKAAQELGAIQSKIKQLAVAKDTIEGIKIHFSAMAKYQSLISVLDILRTEKVNWLHVDGIISVYVDPPPLPAIMVWDRPVFLSCQIVEKIWREQVAQRLKKEQKAQNEQVRNEISHALWASWLLFSALVFFAYSRISVSA